MAKSKGKDEAPKKHAAAASAVPKKTAAPAKPPRAAGGSSGGNAPLIDTSLMAQNAAKMLAAGVNLKNKPQQSKSSKPESSLFKQLKSGLNKPHSTTMDNLLDKTHGPSAGT